MCINHIEHTVHNGKLKLFSLLFEFQVDGFLVSWWVLTLLVHNYSLFYFLLLFTGFLCDVEDFLNQCENKPPFLMKYSVFRPPLLE